MLIDLSDFLIQVCLSLLVCGVAPAEVNHSSHCFQLITKISLVAHFPPLSSPAMGSYLRFCLHDKSKGRQMNTGAYGVSVVGLDYATAIYQPAALLPVHTGEIAIRFRHLARRKKHVNK